MIPKRILEAHYAEYAAQPDAWVKNMEVTKRSIVEQVFRSVPFNGGEGTNGAELVRVAVLGASDRRYLPIHERIFAGLLEQPVQVSTLDIDRTHLAGYERVIEHDVTQPFPNQPYDIIFSHELAKFLSPEEQVMMMRNAYAALGDDGMAMHIVHEPSIKGTSELRDWQYRVNPDHLLEQLLAEMIKGRKLSFDSTSHIDWLRKTTVLVTQK